MTTPIDALKDVTQILVDYWGVANIQVPGIDGKLPVTPSTDNFARLKFQHVGGGQASLADYEGKHKYRAFVNATIELYFPLGAGVIDAYDVAREVMELYEGKRTPNDVWFRQVQLREVTYQSWFRLDVLFSFTYDRIN